MSELTDLLGQIIEQQEFSEPPDLDAANDWLLEMAQEYRDRVSFTKLDDFNVSYKDQATDGFHDAWMHLHHADENELSLWDRQFIDEHAFIDSPPWVDACGAPPHGCARVGEGTCELSCWYDDLSAQEDETRRRYALFLDERWNRAKLRHTAPEPWTTNENLNSTRVLFAAKPSAEQDNGMIKIVPALHATVHRVSLKPPRYGWKCGGESSSRMFETGFDAMRDVEEHYELMHDMPDPPGAVEAVS